MRLRSGLRGKDIVVGTGEVATRDSTVVVKMRMFLNRGDELPFSLLYPEKKVIDLWRRECMAGLRYGIEGMRVGGRRELRISPHLAYGEKGRPGDIPPNAVIRAVVELIEVREPGKRKPEDVFVDMNLNVRFVKVSRDRTYREGWSFYLVETTQYAQFFSFIWDSPWHSPRSSSVLRRFDAETMRSLFDVAFELPRLYPHDCFPSQEDSGDGTDKSYAEISVKSPRIFVNVRKRDEYLVFYYLAANSLALRESLLFQQIHAMREECSSLSEGKPCQTNQ